MAFDIFFGSFFVLFVLMVFFNAPQYYVDLKNYVNLQIQGYANLTPRQKEFANFIGLDQEKYLDIMCEQKDVCKKYNLVRDECATAGNIGECISIKMKSQDYEMCQGTSDATLDGPEFPTSTQCFVNHITKTFKTGA